MGSANMGKTYKLEKLKTNPNQPQKLRSHLLPKSVDTKTDDWWPEDEYDSCDRDIYESGISINYRGYEE